MGDALPPPEQFAALTTLSPLEEPSKKVQVWEWEKYVCEDCDNKACNGQLEWEQHLKSRYHSNRFKRKAVAAQKAKYMKLKAERDDANGILAQRDDENGILASKDDLNGNVDNACQ